MCEQSPSVPAAGLLIECILKPRLRIAHDLTSQDGTMVPFSSRFLWGFAWCKIRGSRVLSLEGHMHSRDHVPGTNLHVSQKLKVGSLAPRAWNLFSIDEDLRTDLEPFGQLLQVLNGERAIALENLRTHARVHSEQASKI